MKFDIMAILPLFLMIFTLCIVVYVLIGSINSVGSFKENCYSFGGEYFEVQNVTCKVFYTYCASNCILHGKMINYYDENLCVADCRFKNNNSNGIRCVC